MDKSDFYKFLKKNNLNGVYEIGKYVTENYSLGNAISLIAESYKPMQNAYDIILENKNVTINCNQEHDTTFQFRIANTTISPNRGFFKKFDNYENLPIIMNKKNNYFFFDAAITNTQYQSEIITTNFGICFYQDESLPLNEPIYNTDNTYKKGEEEIEGKYFYANGYFRGEDPEPRLINLWGLFPKMGVFLNTKTSATQILTETEYDPSLRIVMFGNRNFGEINIAFYSGEKQEIYPLPTIRYLFAENLDIKIVGNVGYWVRQDISFSKPDYFKIILKKSIDKPKIINWLKSISIKRPNFN